MATKNLDHFTNHSPISITIPAHIDLISAALDFTDRMTLHIGFNQKEQGHIRLAIEEIISFFRNTILVGNEFAPIKINFAIKPDGLLTSFFVKGLPLDFENLPDFSPDDDPDNYIPEGLNLFLVKKVMTRIELINNGRNGLEVQIFKNLSKAHIENYIKPDSLPETQLSTKNRASVNFIIRPPEESEAIDIARCAFLTYGYTYEDYIYYQDSIIDMNKTGELCSLVAVNQGSEVLGHCALKFAPGREKIAEIGVLFVKPGLRGHGIGSNLWKAGVDLAITKKLDGIYARSVTNHKASQLIAKKNGFKDCALFLALFPNSVELKSMGGIQKNKMSGMFQWLKLNSVQTKELEIPTRYIRIVKELYDQLNISVEFVNIKKTLSTGKEPLMRFRRNKIFNIGSIHIEATCDMPETILPVISNNLRRMLSEKLDVIYIYINTEHYGAASIIEYCAQSGFVFSGIAPCFFSNGDALVLQYINVIFDPFKDIETCSETENPLLDYIYKELKNTNA